MSDQLLDTPAKHPFSVAAILDRTWHSITEAAFRTGWTPITRLTEAAVISLMERITLGQLRVLTCSHIYEFPVQEQKGLNRESELKAELKVVKNVFWVRLCAMGDLGFAEAYMYGDVNCDDLVSLFRIFLHNQDNLSNINSRLSYLFTIPQKLTAYRFLNTIGNSRSNISAHYDISNEMFTGFLSEDMTYSCAIFEDLDGDMKDGGSGSHGHRPSSPEIPPDLVQLSDQRSNGSRNKAGNGSGRHTLKDKLYNAQMRKLHHVIRKAQIHPGHRVLEIGSGWGSLAILVAQTIPGTRVDTITLSVQQQTLARERIIEAGLEDHVKVHLMDYRNMPKGWEGAFDRVISIEMIEAVGAEFLEKYWQVVDWALHRKDGVGVVQVITIPEARFDRYIREIDFIRKWVQYVVREFFLKFNQQKGYCAVFPGGFLPSVTLLLQAMKAGSDGRLVVDSVSNIGPHYARTLREWRRRFIESFDSIIVPALKREYPDIMCGPKGNEEIEVFRRKWIYYYCYSEVGFTTRTLGDHIISFTREGYQAYRCNIYE